MFAKIFTVAEGRCQVVVMVFKSEPRMDASIKLCFLTAEEELITLDIVPEVSLGDSGLHEAIAKPEFQTMLEEVISTFLGAPTSFTREQGSFATIYTEHDEEDCVLFMSERDQVKMYLLDDEDTLVSCLLYGLKSQQVHRLTHGEIHYLVAVAKGDLGGEIGSDPSAPSGGVLH